MTRREFITLLGGAAAAWPLAARAQQPATLVSIASACWTTPQRSSTPPTSMAFDKACVSSVTSKGRTSSSKSGFGRRRAERYPKLASDLVRLKVDAIVTRGTPAVLAAKNATSTIPIPIISAALAEPLLIVSSISRPEGNVTGLSALTSDLEAKRLELLREIIPASFALPWPYNMANPVFS